MTQQVQTANDAPFFIVGCERSGTTLLRLILDAHPRLCVPTESNFIPALYDTAVNAFGGVDDLSDTDCLLETLFQARRYRLWKLDDDVVREAVRGAPATLAGFLHAVFGCVMAREGKARWGDKTPRYTMQLPALARIFPDARALLMVRDPRDVQVSLRKVDWHGSDPLQNARKWRAYYERGTRDLNECFPDRHMVVSYEALVADPQSCVRRVTDFLAEDFVPEMLDYYQDAERRLPEREGAVRDHALTLKPVTTAAVGRWRTELSGYHTFVVERTAGRHMARLGYSPDAPAMFPARLWYWARYVLKRAKAVGRRHGASPHFPPLSRRNGSSV